MRSFRAATFRIWISYLNFALHIYLLSQFIMKFLNVCSTPAYDWAPNPDKQWILQVTDRMEPIHKKFTDVLMTKRLQTLQSIDEAIERVRKKE